MSPWRGAFYARLSALFAATALGAALLWPAASSAGELASASGGGDPNGPEVETTTNLAKAFYEADERIALLYRVTHEKPVDVSVDLISNETEHVVETFTPPAVTSDDVQKVTWDGLVDGKLMDEGRYRFRLKATDPEGRTTTSSEPGEADRDDFKFLHHFFPIRGEHDYGGAGNRFGAGRAGHSHQGQDVFAACGTDLVAARAGKVQTRQYHSAAGYYLVIDGKKTGEDYVYMHLKKESPRVLGERVRTGQRIGAVGDSGNASGCHLHFELWSKPGWYEGGQPYDPLPALTHWDENS